MLADSLARSLRSKATTSIFAGLRSPCTPCTRALHFKAPWTASSISLQRAQTVLERPSNAWARLRHQSSLASAPRPVVKTAPAPGSRANVSTAAGTAELPTLSPPSVGRWLLISSSLVFAIIVVGGVTRLTESGLSITEWKPITGVIPPITQAEWEEEFEKYKATPEFKLLNHRFTVEEFKSIFFWEWGHRVLGRVIGLGFVLPLGYFAFRRQLARGLPGRLFGLATLIGAQGALGWYMVKSGLSETLMETPGAVPRVSQYRLAAHLGTAFVLYAGMFYTGVSVLQDWRFAKGKAPDVSQLLNHPLTRRFKKFTGALAGLVFLTALSGAFVAGLDAGLLYNEFPLMGGRLMPPTDELFDKAYAKSSSDLWWRNILENPTTVQFDHRVLAMTTYASTALLWGSMMLSPALRAALPAASRRMLHSAFGMANIQVALGISTLLYLVPIPLAAAHQAGSVMLLTTMIHLLVTLRAPGKAAAAWRAALTRTGASAPAAAGATSRVLAKEAATKAAQKTVA